MPTPPSPEFALALQEAIANAPETEAEQVIYICENDTIYTWIEYVDFPPQILADAEATALSVYNAAIAENLATRLAAYADIEARYLAGDITAQERLEERYQARRDQETADATARTAYNAATAAGTYNKDAYVGLVRYQARRYRQKGSFDYDGELWDYQLANINGAYNRDTRFATDEYAGITSDLADLKTDYDVEMARIGVNPPAIPSAVHNNLAALEAKHGPAAAPAPTYYPTWAEIVAAMAEDHLAWEGTYPNTDAVVAPMIVSGEYNPGDPEWELYEFTSAWTTYKNSAADAYGTRIQYPYDDDLETYVSAYKAYPYETTLYNQRIEIAGDTYRTAIDNLGPRP